MGLSEFESKMCVVFLKGFRGNCEWFDWCDR